MKKSYRVVLFVDTEQAECTEDAVSEMQHMIQLYETDAPKASISLSSVAPIEVATGPDGKAA